MLEKVNIVDWGETLHYRLPDKCSKKLSKSLMYAYMMHKDIKIKLPVEAGIISFKI
jgi:hypoxanthine-guanine phosphoribosyltransferase